MVSGSLHPTERSKFEHVKSQVIDEHGTAILPPLHGVFEEQLFKLHT
jgi:hypothetical protein